MNKKEIHAEKQGFPSEAIKRLSLYLRNLKKLREESVELISSAEITQFLNVTPCQFRKDLSYFGGFGKDTKPVEKVFPQEIEHFKSRNLNDGLSGGEKRRLEHQSVILS